MIATRFPPVASAGATRLRKFAKYLPRHGWRPIVITSACPADLSDAAGLDVQTLGDLSADVRIHRVSAIWDGWPAYWAERGARLLHRASAGRLSQVEWERRLEWRLQRWFDRFAMPDRYIHRLLPAWRAATTIHRQTPIDVVFTSGLPFSDHLVGLAVARTIRRPQVAEFRDNWVEYIHDERPRSAAQQWFAETAERLIVRHAARIVSVNDAMTARFRERYPRHASKFVTIRNGFDPADFSAPQPRPSIERFQILYAGSLGRTRDPSPALDGFRAFVRATPEARREAQLCFAGRVGPYAGEFNRPDDGGTIVHVGVLPHREALRRMQSAAVNLMILPAIRGSEGDTTAKLYECLGSGRPVLAIVPRDGAAANELRPFDGTWVRDPTDADGIAAAIGELYSRWRSKTLNISRLESQLLPLTRAYQAGQLAQLLDAQLRTCVGSCCLDQSPDRKGGVTLPARGPYKANGDPSLTVEALIAPFAHARERRSVAVRVES